MREKHLEAEIERGQSGLWSNDYFSLLAGGGDAWGSWALDWVLLDNEHGNITVDNVEDLVRAADLTGIAPIVRPVGNRPEIIAPFLDPGRLGSAGPAREYRR